MITANLMAMFPLVTTPWWIWAMVILAMLAVLGVSILISTRSNSENPPAQPPEHIPGQQAEPPKPEANAASQTAESDAKHMQVSLPESEAGAPSQLIEALPLTLLPEEKEEEIENGPLPAALADGSHQDDLKRVRGISPSTAAVLHQAGIHSFAQLAETDAGDLEKILRAAGMRTVDPHSWPEQAQLAAAGDWNALGELQEQLEGKR